MNVGVSSAALATIVCLAVAIGVLFQRPYRSLYTRFSAFCSALFLWHGAAFVSHLWPDRWPSIQNLSGLLIPPTLILFFAELMRDRSRYMQTLIRSSLALSFLFFLVTLTPLHDTFLVEFLLALYVIGVGVAVLKLLHNHLAEANSETERTRLRFVLYGSAITLLFGAGQAIPVSPLPALGHVAVTFWVYFLFQSIVARRLMNMVELLGKAAVVGVLTLVLATIYSVLVLWVGQEQQGLWLFNTIVASFVILILYDQLRPWVERTTSKLLFRQQYELRLVALRLVRRLRSAIRVETMQNRLLDTLYREGVITEASVYVRDAHDMAFRLVGHRGQPPPTTLSAQRHPSLIQELRRERRPILMEDLTYRGEEFPLQLTRDDPGLQRTYERNEEAIALLESMGAMVVIPMLHEERIVGLFALGGPGAKRLASEDLTALLSVGESAAIVIENSKEFELRRERDRLVEIGEMATGMAHEIRNPLGAIKGAAQCLNPDALQEDQQEFVDVIIEEVDRLGGVVGQFLDYARPYHGNPQPTAVNDVVSQTVRLFTHDKLSPDLMIIQDLTHDLPAVNVDPEQLKQVLFNLMRNAVEAMDGAGDITIKTSINHVPIHQRRTNDGPERALENENVVVKVIDNGPGIAPEHLKRIFLPFFTTKTRGTGLGLAICQRMVENSGGRLEVASELEVGTTFTLHFKVTSDTVKASSPQGLQPSTVVA